MPKNNEKSRTSRAPNIAVVAIHEAPGKGNDSAIGTYRSDKASLGLSDEICARVICGGNDYGLTHGPIHGLRKRDRSRPNSGLLRGGVRTVGLRVQFRV
jgi:hypothetical protein